MEEERILLVDQPLAHILQFKINCTEREVSECKVLEFMESSNHKLAAALLTLPTTNTAAKAIPDGKGGGGR